MMDPVTAINRKRLNDALDALSGGLSLFSMIQGHTSSPETRVAARASKPTYRAFLILQTFLNEETNIRE